MTRQVPTMTAMGRFLCAGRAHCGGVAVGGAAADRGGRTGRAHGADGADGSATAPADAGEATAAQKSKNLYHAFRGTNVCTFVPRISSAPFFWGVIASCDRVYTSSSAPQCERIGPPGGPIPTINLG
jgi:hypothetical protein